MPGDKPRKSIWNKLLIAVVIVIAGLIALALFVKYESERTLDMTMPYTAENTDDGDYSTAELFASNLVTSRGFVDIEGFSLTDNSERALLFNTETLEAVYAHSIYERAYPASLTKIMTAILAVKYGNMDDTVVMQDSDFALEEGSQNSDMKPGDSVTMKQLLEVLLVHSANDAAMAIARQVSGSTDAFVELMNNEARSYGLLGTHFANPHGLHDDSHYTCAYDVYLMLNEAMNYQLITETMRMNSYTLQVDRGGSPISYHYDATNEFLTGQVNAPEGVRVWGGKTGTTPEAGACLAVIAQSEEGIPYIAVIMNSPKKTVLYDDMRALLSYAS